MTAICVPERLALQRPMQWPLSTPSVHARAHFSVVLDPPDHAERWRRALKPLLPQWHLVEPADAEGLAKAQVLLTNRPNAGLVAAMPHLRLVQVLGNSVDAAMAARLPPRARVARTCCMHQARQSIEYALTAVLQYHRGFDVYAAQQRRGHWQPLPVRTANERRVGIMGLGQLGSKLARQLAALGFRVRGWSRTPREVEGVTTFHEQAGLESFLRACEILVCLLPLTPQTRGLVARPVFDALPPGARLVHIGHAAQIVQDDLLAALADGRLAHATLDGLDTLDGSAPHAAHPLWQHPCVSATPGVAAHLGPEVGAALVARNLDRWARNDSLLNLIDRERGY